MATPAYAMNISADKRIKYHCRASCGDTVYGELNLSKMEAKNKLKKVQQNQDSDEPVGISVKCGKCSYEQDDWYNWPSEFLEET